jgi:hypothetical protein
VVSIKEKLESASLELDNPNISLARVKELSEELSVPLFSDPQKLGSLSPEIIKLVNSVSMKS